MLTIAELTERLGEFTEAEVAAHVEAGMPLDEQAAIGWLIVNGHITPRRIVNAKFIASYFNVTLPAVKAWGDCPVLEGGNFYDLDEVVKWRLSKLRARQSDSKEALAQARAEKLQTEVAQLQGSLVSAAEVAMATQTFIPESKMALRDFHDSVPAMIDKGLDRDALIGEFRKAISRAVDALEDLRNEHNDKLQRFQKHLDDRGITLVEFTDSVIASLAKTEEQ